MSQAHEQRTLFYLKGLGRFFIFISTSLPCGAQKKSGRPLLRGFLNYPVLFRN